MIFAQQAFSATLCESSRPVCASETRSQEPFCQPCPMGQTACLQLALAPHLGKLFLVSPSYPSGSPTLPKPPPTNVSSVSPDWRFWQKGSSSYHHFNQERLWFNVLATFIDMRTGSDVAVRLCIYWFYTSGTSPHCSPHTRPPPPPWMPHSTALRWSRWPKETTVAETQARQEGGTPCQAKSLC